MTSLPETVFVISRRLLRLIGSHYIVGKLGAEKLVELVLGEYSTSATSIGQLLWIQFCPSES
jgi:hypothetical protein